MKDLKFKNVTIFLTGANGEMFEYHKNNEYKNQSKQDINNPKAFNTYNWGAPITLCGVANEDIYDGIAVVNIHTGGDVRGNYSEPYICEEPESIFSQNTYLDIELTNGDTYSFYCDNGEAYFSFNTFDAYYIDFDKQLTTEQLTELEERNEINN